MTTDPAVAADPGDASDGAAPVTVTPGARRGPRWVLPAAALLYLVAAIELSRPAWSHPTTSTVGGPGDSDKFMGFFAWFPFALTHGHNPLHMTYIDLPIGINAMWDTTMPLASLLIWPVRAAFGVVAAYNVTVLLSLTLDGYCTFLWLRRHTRHQVAAMVASLMMVAGPYAAARTYGHLNLLMYFPLPLMFLLIEDILREPRAHPVRRGAALGALAAVQILLTEEPLALAAVAIAIALVVAAALAPRRAWATGRALLPAAIATAAGFLVIAGGPLAYQFLGPSIVHGAIQVRDVYVNDVNNFFVPTGATAISLGGPGVLGGPVVPWTGNPIEWNAYVGIPLALVFLFSVFRWWRTRWLLVIALTTAAVAILSLGPHLHVNGVDHVHYPLPEAVLDKLPVFENILPNRFSLLMDFGLAAVVALFLDATLTTSRRWLRAGGLVATALVAVSLWPAIVPSSAAPTPAYFQGGGDVDRVAPGTAVLVFPIPYDGPPETAEPAMWQAVADFRFKMVSGASISAKPNGLPAFGSTAQPLRCVVDGLQLTGDASSCNVDPSAVLEQLHHLGVHLIVMAPATPHLDAISAYVSGMTGEPPVSDEGVLVWSI